MKKFSKKILVLTACLVGAAFNQNVVLGQEIAPDTIPNLEILEKNDVNILAPTDNTQNASMQDEEASDQLYDPSKDGEFIIEEVLHDDDQMPEVETEIIEIEGEDFVNEMTADYVEEERADPSAYETEEDSYEENPADESFIEDENISEQYEEDTIDQNDSSHGDL